jgi:hypothetical protein
MPRQVRIVDGRPEIWLPYPSPGGWVCAEPDTTTPDGMCGTPTESEPCQHRAAGPVCEVQVNEGLVVRDGDTVLLRVHTGADARDSIALRDRLQQALGGRVSVLVVACDQVAVLRPVPASELAPAPEPPAGWGP